MRRQKGRGARENQRAVRRSEYAAQVAPLLQNEVQLNGPGDRVLLLGDELVDLALALAPKLTEGALALVVTEFELWDAARAALAGHANATVVQELAELDDPDGFDVPPWTLGVFLSPFHIGIKAVFDLLHELTGRMAINAPIYAGGTRTHDFVEVQERLSALAGPLTVVRWSDPVKIVQGRVIARGRMEERV